MKHILSISGTHEYMWAKVKHLDIREPLSAEIKRKINTHLHFIHLDVSLNTDKLYGFSFYKRKVALATINTLKTSMLGCASLFTCFLPYSKFHSATTHFFPEKQIVVNDLSES